MRLPDAEDVVYMAGMKFGATGQAALTWAENCLIPASVCRRYASSRIVAFSTGNVYPLMPAGRGSREDDPAAPAGEYAMSCLGRERMFEYFSSRASTPVTLLRLNYACELRYGVLVDLARRVWVEEPVDVTTGSFNVIWQGDANAMSLAALTCATVPPHVLNVTGPEELSVRAVSRGVRAPDGKTRGIHRGRSRRCAVERCVTRVCLVREAPRQCRTANRLDRRLDHARRRHAWEGDEVRGARRQVLTPGQAVRHTASAAAGVGVQRPGLLCLYGAIVSARRPLTVDR